MITPAIAALLVVTGVWTAVRGAQLVGRAIRCADDESSSLSLIRGIRGLVVAIAAWSLAAGLASAQTWLVVFGVVFLAEELYETGIVLLILRRSSAPS